MPAEILENDLSLQNTTWNPAEVPDQVDIPAGMPMEMEITQAVMVKSADKDKTTGAAKISKLMAVMEFTVVKPTDYKGLAAKRYFVLGTDDAPLVALPRNATPVKQVIAFSGTAETNNLFTNVNACKGAHVGVIAKKGKATDQYPNPRSEIYSFFKLGTKDVPEVSTQFNAAGGTVTPTPEQNAANAASGDIAAAKAKLAAISASDE